MFQPLDEYFLEVIPSRDLPVLDTQLGYDVVKSHNFTVVLLRQSKQEAVYCGVSKRSCRDKANDAIGFRVAAVRAWRAYKLSKETQWLQRVGKKVSR